MISAKRILRVAGYGVLGLGIAAGGMLQAGERTDPAAKKAEETSPTGEKNSMNEHGRGPKNRLAGESSPYLLLHQTNPVDWYPWGEEALEKARREDKPIFLSVGYSTCYWCHVMERESFSNPKVAALMNEYFVNIKVDREERPDLDEIYMTATQMLTQRGGWPNSVFLTPDLKPFFAGTYFPPEDRYGRPGFSTLVTRLAEAWKTQRDEVEESAGRIAEAMKRYLEERAAPTAAVPAASVAQESLKLLAGRYDATWGGFGGAPKFPTPSNLFLALEMAPEDEKAGDMLAATLDHMARGGIYDQLAGGFHRYSTDQKWLVPHFEKMLYDNGFLLELYAREYGRSADPEAARIAREIAGFLAREMTSEEGALWSAIDAETDGHEGAYYVWARQELEEILGKDAVFLAPLFGFGEAPNFEESHYVLHFPEPVAQLAAQRKVSLEALHAKIGPLKTRLLAVRSQRERPLTDDKILADWNGIGITGLATAGRILEDEGMVNQARRAADFVLTKMRPKGGPLLHSWRAGQGKIVAYLSDYAFLVRGLLALHEANGEKRWLDAARELSEEQIQRLRDAPGGFFVAEARPDLLVRSKDVLDGALPSPNAISTLNFLELADRTGEIKWRREAEASLKAFGALLEQSPEGLRMLSIAAWRYGAQGSVAPREASALDVEAEELVQASLARTPPIRSETEGPGQAFRLRLEVARGWHVNANPASDEFLIPTTLAAPEEGELEAVQYPTGEEFKPAFAEAAIRVYQGSVEITGEIRGSDRVILTYQPCDEDRCLPPVTKELRFSE